MDDQTQPPDASHPFGHLCLRDTRSQKERMIAEFNERQRRRGSRKRWHDYYPEDAANDDQQRPHP